MVLCESVYNRVGAAWLTFGHAPLIANLPWLPLKALAQPKWSFRNFSTDLMVKTLSINIFFKLSELVGFSHLIIFK
jgi:hypothetical protein